MDEVPVYSPFDVRELSPSKKQNLVRHSSQPNLLDTNKRSSDDDFKTPILDQIINSPLASERNDNVFMWRDSYKMRKEFPFVHLN